MSFIVEQKIKGNIYLYRVESHWDKSKKKTYQKRTYLGPKFPTSLNPWEKMKHNDLDLWKVGSRISNR